MKKYPLFYPFLFAVFPALFLYSHNIDEVDFRVIIAPLLLSLGLTAAVWLVFTLTVKNRHKSALLTFIFAFMFFSYGHFYNALNSLFFKELHLPAIILLVLWLALFAWISFIIIKKQKHLDKLSSILSVFVSCLVLVSIIQIGLFHFKLYRSSLPPGPMTDDLSPDAELFEKKDRLPDIYYLIFDRYARADILRKYYGYDNKPFINFLKSKGFYVASRSQCNYPASYLSISSALNMHYHDYLLKEGPIRIKVIYRLLKDFKVQRLLKSLGYSYIHFGSWWEATKSNKYADINFRMGGVIPLSQEFILKLLQTTVLTHLTEGLVVVEGRRKQILNKFKKLAEVPERNSPKFIFAHFILPHKPFLFAADGKKVSNKEKKIKDVSKLYIAQLQFTNEKIRELIDVIFEKSKNPPVIILQADEGPRGKEMPGELSEFDREILYKIRCPIFNALYLPGKERAFLYETISPVNTFRLIFNLYFGTHYELLEDKSYRPTRSNDGLIETFELITVK